MWFLLKTPLWVKGEEGIAVWRLHRVWLCMIDCNRSIDRHRLLSFLHIRGPVIVVRLLHIMRSICPFVCREFVTNGDSYLPGINKDQRVQKNCIIRLHEKSSGLGTRGGVFSVLSDGTVNEVVAFLCRAGLIPAWLAIDSNRTPRCNSMSISSSNSVDLPMGNKNVREKCPGLPRPLPTVRTFFPSPKFRLSFSCLWNRFWFDVVQKRKKSRTQQKKRTVKHGLVLFKKIYY